jgi:membrane-associated phospholipid phosphatase
MTIETSYTESPIENPLPVLPKTRDRRVARWVSNFGSPPLMAVSAVLISAAEITGRAAWSWAGFMITFAILLPIAYVFSLLKRRKITDFDVYLREQRFWPYVFSITCGALSWLVMAIFHAPRLFIVLSGATVGQGLLMFLINQRWKISAHAAGSAGIAVIIWQLMGISSAPIFLIIPLVGWSRVRLGRHTTMQVVAGAALGIVVFLTSLAIWY